VVKLRFPVFAVYFVFRAHPRACGAGTGLSACIFFAAGKKGYRFYPLREPKPFRGFG
jgi:hypothetical protein